MSSSVNLSSALNPTSSTSSSSSTSGTTTDASGLSHYFGLASGLDVDSIVKGLMAGDQKKLDLQNQKKQTLEWQQSAYQGFITSLRTFENTYLTMTTDGNMLTASTYCNYTGTSSDTSLSVSGNADAAPGMHTIKIYQSEVDGMVTGAQLKAAITGTTNVSAGANVAGTSFRVTVDDVTKTISFGGGETFSADSLNSKLQAAFGVDNTQHNACKVQAAVDGSGHLTIESGGGYQSVISVSDPASGLSSLSALGLTSGASNRVNIGFSSSGSGSSLASLFGSAITVGASGNFSVNINGTSIALNTGDNIYQTLSKINAAGAGVTASYNNVSGNVVIKSSQGGSSGTVNLNDNGTGFFNALLGSSPTVTTGRDAIVSIDGQMVTRNSNDFTVDGISYTINNSVSYTTNPSSIQINLRSNVDGAVKSIQGFVDAYNKLITSINTAITTKPDSSYKPLTASQQSTMSSDAIQKWNQQAQQGILFNDPTLNNIVTGMRDMLDSTVVTAGGKSVSLYDIGITTGDYSEMGELHVNETKLKTALEDNPNEVADLFTKTSSIPYNIAGGTEQSTRMGQEGMMYRLQDIINNATDAAGGTLPEICGMPGEVSEFNNQLYTQLKDLNGTISDLTDQYKSDQTKYYNQFTQLEMYISQMNEQSANLSQMMGGSSSN